MLFCSVMCSWCGACTTIHCISFSYSSLIVRARVCRIASLRAVSVGVGLIEKMQLTSRVMPQVCVLLGDNSKGVREVRTCYTAPILAIALTRIMLLL